MSSEHWKGSNTWVYARSPEHVPTVLAIADGVEAAVDLDLDDLVDTLVFQAWQIVALLLVLLDGVAFVQELGGTQEGAEMFLPWKYDQC